MGKFNKMYREFFGLREQEEEKYGPEALKNLQAFNTELEKTKELMGEDELAEAELTNNITDYQGHVMYNLRDPQEAKMVAKDIMQWTNKKGFTIIKHERSASGKTGYFYFRLGEDPGTESQKIQGYFSQMPEIARFAFKAPASQRKI